MKQKLIYGGVVVLAVAAAVIAWAIYQPANNPNFPEGTDWLCTTPSCATHFKLTTTQLSEHYKQNYGQRPKCAKCGKDAVRAEVCGHCGKVYPQNRGAQVCPHCGKQQIEKAA